MLTVRRLRPADFKSLATGASRVPFVVKARSDLEMRPKETDDLNDIFSNEWFAAGKSELGHAKSVKALRKFQDVQWTNKRLEATNRICLRACSKCSAGYNGRSARFEVHASAAIVDRSPGFPVV